MMDNQKALLFVLTIFFFSRPSPVIGSGRLLPTNGEGDDASHLHTYIIHVQKPQGIEFAGFEDRQSWHKSFLPISAANSGETRLVYSYDNVISGFAARLTREELKVMEEMDGFLHATPDQLLALQTTHSPSFLGLHQENGFWAESNFGKGVIIGLLDTGIFPTHPSFSDDGMPPPPSKWKGRCEFNKSSCNNKLIGARVFLQVFAQGRRTAGASSPVDNNGHGTHTSSTAAGNFVKNAGVLGNAKGTAVGMAPRAHLAIYKVCGDLGICYGSDILAGLDQAITDGVDVVSISLGGYPRPLYVQAIAIGTLAAIEKGVFVSCSAGNLGQYPRSVANGAPWILTVGASTMDRRIMATVKLGNGEEFDGESAYQPKGFLSALQLPLIYPGANGDYLVQTCYNGSLDSYNLKGKVVLCLKGISTGIEKGEIVKGAGGAAMILMNRKIDGSTTYAEAHVLPASQVTYSDAERIKDYVNSTSAPTATILFKCTQFGLPSPAVASFSSRGPSMESPGILKPDIIGPGVNVLAAWPFHVGPPANSIPSSTSTFNFLSGTSMSTPHLSGIAALLKSSHPDWSPAAIRSAIMTTSDVLNNYMKPIGDGIGNHHASFFAMGAGHVNPSKANDPGLIYDLVPGDYILYLCSLGYNDSQVSAIARRPVKCSNTTRITGEEFNYPSFSVSVGSSLKTVKRTVTNVGEASSAYSVEIDVPNGVSVNVQPKKLYFSEVNQKAGFMVSFSRSSKGAKGGIVSEGQLRWVSDKHVVRSPISVTFM